eukprot:1596127-Lingulodinium_polyedra.AAC.1
MTPPEARTRTRRASGGLTVGGTRSPCPLAQTRFLLCSVLPSRRGSSLECTPGSTEAFCCCGTSPLDKA